jgi:hypothetical protein
MNKTTFVTICNYDAQLEYGFKSFINFSEVCESCFFSGILTGLINRFNNKTQWQVKTRGK